MKNKTNRAGRINREKSRLIAEAVRKIKLPAVLLVAGLLAMALPVSPAGATGADYFDLSHLSERSEGYYVLKDEATGRVILSTALLLHAGDQFIDGENRSYRITRVEGDTAWADLEKKEEGASLGSQAGEASPAAPAKAGERKAVGIYHSHGAESYVPSDGSDSNDSGGGIIEVGTSFTRALQEKGIKVEHIMETHVPHDAGAYNRSRRTAAKLVSDNLDAIFDVHRDAVPEEEYDRDIDGRDLVQIMMVIGHQNQNMNNNKSFAEGLKRVADANHPGLIKGILVAQGNFNQDLSPRAILIEVGAHTNSRQQAEESAALFADVVNNYLYAQQGRAGGGGIAVNSAIRLAIALVLAIFIYLLISAGSWEEVKKKVVSFFTREFADLKKELKIRGDNKEDDPDS